MKAINIKKILSLKNFLLLWSGQTLSQMGSSMTSFALIIWAYQKQGTVMSIALLSVFSYLPYVLVSFFAGALIDRLNKKKIMLTCDAIATICSLCAFSLLFFGMLDVWHLYVINVVSGFMNAFQAPASKVVTTLIVPKEHYTRVSGLRSLSDSVISVFSPILATTIISLLGISIVFVIDFMTFVIAFLSLLLLVKIPYKVTEAKDSFKANIIKESLQGYDYLKENKGFLYLILFISGINFLASIAFFNVLPAMILTLSGNNEKILGLVTGAVGVGGIVGSLLVTICRPPKSHVKAIFISAALSYLLCDLLLGIGKTPLMWTFAAFAGNLPIPFLNASENYLLMSKIPQDIQGRIFSIRGSLKFITMPAGYLIGGLLSDKVFEPLMAYSQRAQQLFGGIVGVGKGSGMALIFIITGILGFSFSVISYSNKHIRRLDD